MIFEKVATNIYEDGMFPNKDSNRAPSDRIPSCSGFDFCLRPSLAS